MLPHGAYTHIYIYNIYVPWPSQLASIFLLHVCTMVCGFATEWWSRPRLYPDEEEYTRPLGPGKHTGVEVYTLLRNSFAPKSFCGFITKLWSARKPEVAPMMICKGGNPNALKRIAQDEWSGDRPLRFYSSLNNEVSEDKMNWLNYVYIEGLVDLPYFQNFVRRMLPHAFGYVPMIGAWVMMIK